MNKCRKTEHTARNNENKRLDKAAPDYEPKVKLKEITDKLEQGIKELFSSGQYDAYLKAMAKFYDYSYGNTLLIVMQMPDATLVAGYQTWRTKFKRHVLKGAKGIKIIAPSPYKTMVETEKLDPITQRPCLAQTGYQLQSKSKLRDRHLKP